MFCTNCGGEVPAGGSFCGMCGTQMQAVQAGAAVPPPPPAAPVWTAPATASYPPPAFAQPPAFAPPPAYAPPMPPPYAAPPPPAFAPPAYAPPMAPPYAAQAPRAPVMGSPVPPNMHWAVVLILSWVTGGLAGVIWMFKQAAFVKKIDPSNKAIPMLVIAMLAMVGQLGLVFSMMGSRSMSDIAALTAVMMVLNLVIVVVGLIAVFGMRSSIVRYYNTVEPIGLQLSGVMTFFFSILYFQHHFSRIAAWKQTGRLN
jgi:hypothetical protein